MSVEKHFGLRIDDILLKKFRYICEYEGRSANSQIIYMIRKEIAEYEKTHGEIKIDTDDK